MKRNRYVVRKRLSVSGQAACRLIGYGIFDRHPRRGYSNGYPICTVWPHEFHDAKKMAERIAAALNKEEVTQ